MLKLNIRFMKKITETKETNYIKYQKESLRLFLNSFSLLVMVTLYLIMISFFYNGRIEIDFGIRGYIVLGILYILISYAFNSAFGTFYIGNKKIMDIALSGILSILFISITMYFVLALIEGHLISVFPHLILTVIQSLTCLFISYNGTILIRSKIPPQKTLVIYSDKNYKEILKKLNKYQIYEFDFVKSESEKKFNYKKDELSKYDCILTIDISHNNKKKLVKLCYENNKDMYDIPSITDIVIKSSEVMNFIDTPIFKMNKLGPSQVEKVIKRIVDLIGATLMLIVTSPIMIICAIVIKLQDGGDVFFRQKRLTIDGKEFELVKFRSMIMNAEPNGKVIRAKENDSRITAFGKFIRSTRIDELPQIFNIFTGSMSFVGPRALRIEEYKENEKNFPEFKYRLKVKAGLTGYAQIYGKYNTSFRDKLLLDVYYIENYNLIEDFKLLLMTAVTMLKKDSTEGF